jgi:hypothetical protein
LEGIGDFLNERLDDFEDVLLGESMFLGSEAVGDFDGEFAFGDGGHGGVGGVW